MDNIVAEQFSLTPAIKAFVNMNIFRLRALLPEDASVNVFLSEPAEHRFTVLLKVRSRGQDLTARESSENLFQALNTARNHLQRRIVAQHDYAISERRTA